jgi:alanine-synthesizing transaminase
MLDLVYPDEFYAELFDPRGMIYDPEPFGLDVARQAVAEHYYARRGHRINPERICLSASTSEAYGHLLALLCDPGDIILVPSPSYPLLDYLAELARVELVTYPVNYDGHWSVDTAALAKLVERYRDRAKAIVCVAPNSPTGSYLTGEELRAIEALCCQAELTLVVDEALTDYPLFPGPSRVASVVDNGVAERECLTFVLSGLSKVAALPQFKLAWTVACGPDELVRPALARLAVIADAYLNLATGVQLALPHIFAASETMQGQIRRRMLTNLQTLDAAITDSPVSRLSVEAGWSTILKLPCFGELDDEGWVLRMLERIDVWAQPGSLYDMHGCHLVLSLLTRPHEFAEGLARLVACVEQECLV